jgi:pimeloyl-ACP methyl ester carboxylesterase
MSNTRLGSLLVLAVLAFVVQPAFGQASRFAKLDDVRVHYLDQGKGSEALLFVHGWTCSAAFWKPQTAYFAGRTRVIAIDLPGHGESDKPKTAYSMDLFARSIDAVMRDAGVTRAVLVGHSMGTPVIRQFYRRYPDKTIALVIVDGPVKQMFPDKAAADNFLEQLRSPDYQKTAGQMVSYMVQPMHDPALKEQVKTAMLSTPQHVAVSAFEGMLDPAIWAEDKISVPTLAIMARQPAWNKEYEAYAHSLVPNLEFQVWDGVSHFLMMDKPDEFNSTVSAFLVKIKFLKQ